MRLRASASRPLLGAAASTLPSAHAAPTPAAAAPYLPHRLAHAAAQPGECRVRRRRGARADELHHALRLRQVEAAVQKRAQRELPGPRRPRAGLDGGAQHAAAADGAAVALQLNDVLARVGPGGAGEGERW
jgi:hypothetical protein